MFAKAYSYFVIFLENLFVKMIVTGTNAYGEMVKR